MDDLCAQQRGKQKALVDEAPEVAEAALAEFSKVDLAFSLGQVFLADGRGLPTFGCLKRFQDWSLIRLVLLS